MAVDYVRMRVVDAELLKDFVANVLAVAKSVVCTFLLLVQLLVGDEITLERSHLVLVEQRRVWTAPQVPQIVERKTRRVVVIVEECSAHQLVNPVEQSLPGKLLTEDCHLLERAVGIQRNRGMEKQIVVAHKIHASLGHETADMLAQLLAVGERIVELLHQIALLRRQTVRIVGVDCRKLRVEHLILFSTIAKHTALKVNLIKQQTAIHAKFRMALYDARLQFELNHGYRLVHLRNEAQRLFRISFVGIFLLQRKHRAWVVGIRIHCERGERQQVDAISLLERSQRAVAHRDAYHVGYTAVVARRGTHPQNIVVTPLDVEIMIITESIHDNMRTRSAVENVAHDVERVNREPLNQVTHRDDEIVGTLS